MTSFSATRCKVGVAAAASVITTIGLVAVPQEGMGAASTRVEVATVQLDAILAAEVSSLVLSAPETDSAATTPIPDASTIQEAVGAATSGIAATLTGIGRTILDVIGFAIAPLWWLALPVTYGIYLETRRQQSQGSYIPTVLDAAGWMFAPFNLGTVLFGRAGSSTAAPGAAAEEWRSPDALNVEFAPAETSLRAVFTTEPTLRPNSRAKVSAPRAKTTVPPSAAVSTHAGEAVPHPDAPSAGRGKAATSKADRQRASVSEVTKAGPRT